ncbi:hypothetical protein [Pseudomonas reactans]
MDTGKFIVSDAELNDARVSAQTGQAHILVLEGGPPRFFVAQEVLGYLSWTAILGESPERIDIGYGSDLSNGFYEFDVSQLRLWYRGTNGVEHYSPVSGTVWLSVERPEFGTSFTHTGILLNIRFETDAGAVSLNGTFRNSSD